jgi:hypothetical protein
MESAHNFFDTSRYSWSDWRTHACAVHLVHVCTMIFLKDVLINAILIKFFSLFGFISNSKVFVQCSSFYAMASPPMRNIDAEISRSG